MRTPPTDLSDARLQAAVATQWSITAEALSYAPVGFGSHHWVLAGQDGGRYFVTADAVADAHQRLTHLSVALGTAYALRHQCGLRFVVAPQPGHDGRLLAITGRYAIALYPYLERSGDAAASPQQLLAMINELHASTPDLRDQVTVDDLSIPDRAIVEGVLDGGQTAGGGDAPYAARVVNLLRSQRDVLWAAFCRYDSLASAVATGSDTWVITHGEPKANNTMITAAGAVLVDWDTVQVAPTARDVWLLPSPNDYAATTGRQVPADQLHMYRLRWDLKDLCHFTSWLTHASRITPDTDRAWKGTVEICQRLEASR